MSARSKARKRALDIAKEKGAKLEAKLEKVVLDGLGLKTEVHVRDLDQLDAIIAANPFKPFAKTNPNFLVVNFMRAPASKAEMEAMAKTSLTGEEVRQGESEAWKDAPTVERSLLVDAFEFVRRSIGTG
mgnify:CR=1 FL=1